MITNTISIPPSFPPKPAEQAPSPAPSTSPISVPIITPQKQSINFSPPLIAMVVVIGAAFLLVTYSRLIARSIRRITQWRNLHRIPSSETSSFYASPITDGFHPHSPFGLDESFIKTIPLSLYTASRKTPLDCAVCLIELEHGNYVRTLPVCMHAFHVDCIDTWLTSHANCPVCRAHVLVSKQDVVCKQDSPFVPMMSSRIRPSLDERDAILFEAGTSMISMSPDIVNNLKRSYSFGYERNMEGNNRRSFWSRRTSPFGVLSGKGRVFSFRGVKSPFFRRKGFFPMSEGGMSSRRRRSESSRLRCGDPEALLSPERYRRR